MTKQVYLDNAATTKIDPQVAEFMQESQTNNYGNPSSQHSAGRAAREAIENSRMVIADKIGAKKEEIVFTSGGTEADNLAIKGVARAREEGHIITSKAEHKAVLETCQKLQNEGFGVTYLDVDENGVVNPEDVRDSIQEDTILVSIMTANNVTGAINPVKEIGKICREKDVLFHTDAVQAFCKESLSVRALKSDLMTVSAHKVHGPKGVGALYVKKGTELRKMLEGGPHEQNLRAGTQNVAGIIGFAKAVDLFQEADVEKMREMRDYMIDELTRLDGVELNGPREKRLVNNINLSFKGFDATQLVKHLDNKGIQVSAGSACTSQELRPSHVLEAMGLSKKKAQGSIRVTLGRFNEKEDIEYAVESIKDVATKLRKIEVRGAV